MRTNHFPRRRLAVVVAIGMIAAAGAAYAQKTAELPLRDDFDSKFSLDWETVRPEPTHVSLTAHPGKLTITTQYGSIHMDQTTAKNLYFVDPPEGDFVVTTCIEDFLPETVWQQAGLLFYDDDDNFIKWVRDYAGQGCPVLNVHWEVAQQPGGAIAPVEVNKQRFWLRVIKRGNVYQCLASNHGKTFTTYGVAPFGDGAPKKVGLVAKNGPREGDLEAQFDFFEIRRPTEAELADPVFETRRSLPGTWKAVERELSGEPIAGNQPTRLIATPGTLKLTDKGGLAFSYVVDPTASPCCISLIPRAHGVGKLLNGIYTLKGDALTVCLNTTPNGPAPAEFQTAEGDGRLLLKFERVEQ